MHGVGFTATQNQRFDIKSLAEKTNSVRNDNSTIAQIIAQTCGKDQEKVMKDIHDITRFNSKQALEYGLVHEIKNQLYEKGARLTTISS